MKKSVPSVLLIALLAFAQTAVQATVRESAREIPVVKEVDVVVVGGSSGAVTAAVAAAEGGAKVFLVAPRTFLGDDLCATMRLWLEPGETPATPLAKQMFTLPARGRSVGLPDAFPGALSYTYSTDQASSKRHADTKPESKLKDGLFEDASKHSVQYDSDVSITADLGSVKHVREAALVSFFATGANYNAGEIGVATSLDAKTWKTRGSVKCEGTQQGGNVTKIVLGDAVRYVRLAVKRAAESERLLLGELAFLGDAPKAGPVAAPEANAEAGVAAITTPMQVKRTLDEALLAAKIDFLFTSYPTELLVDDAGNPAGIVMTNRTGRQAVKAKVIVDATPRATVARMAGAKFQPYPAGEQVFQRVVVGGELVSGAKLSGRNTGHTLRVSGMKASAPASKVFEYTLRLPMPDSSFASFAAADQLARNMTYHPGQMDDSEDLFQVPPDAMQGMVSGGEAATVAIDACRPAGVKRLYVVGGCVDVSRKRAAALMRPLALMDLGTRLGAAAAAEAKGIAAAGAVRVSGGVALKEAAGAGVHAGEVKEFLTSLRPSRNAAQHVASAGRDLPVLGVYDVVVVGGGTGGAPAGIGAARAGARTLVLEYLHGMGGVATMGMITKYYHGYRGGFTAEVDKGVAGMKTANDIVGKSEWWRQTNLKSGATIWFGVLGGGAVVNNGVVVGVVVATPEGRGVVMARTVIDSTGNADIAAAAGAECSYTDGTEASVQGTGLPPWELGANYTNTDWMFADDTDVVDFWHHFVLGRQKFKNA